MDNVKRAQVIMLPTKESKLQLSNINGVLVYSDDIRIREHTISQHLYIISDDEIKKGDWYYNTNIKTIQKRKYLSVAGSNDRKIIATTDTSLTNDIKMLCKNCKGSGGGFSPKCIICKGDGIRIEHDLLPQPSQQFIEKYIQAYNKGEVITDVLVEYELHKNSFVPLWIPKINPKDNTITIKKLKDSWNREEIEVILQLAEKDLDGCGCLEADKVLKIIRENL